MMMGCVGGTVAKGRGWPFRFPCQRGSGSDRKIAILDKNKARMQRYSNNFRA